ncbi:hypothetical protein [Thalassotalea sp. ND16A]|uniref:hypothetical protein n=1 Tax=Thalassotalea sp. ND16A TaxID=1535422 RepID=UPI00051A67DC|nr:hypothetical protein [Thalassotalea sp. ND16A]KGJ89264.1 hypothetical protein ND16A_2157 [Thalassotalea sp. ND16A]
MNMKTLSLALFVSVWLVMVSFSVNSEADKTPKLSESKKHVIEHWTPARRNQAIPRDLVLDRSGNAFLKGRNGQLTPYGLAKDDPKFNRKPDSGSKDTTAPSFANINPDVDAEPIIGDSATFSADITDDSGVRSAKVIIRYPSSTQTQSFSANQTSGDTWSVTIEGFTDGDWSWKMEAKDGSSGKGNTGAFADWVDFTINTAGVPVDPGTDDGNTVTNSSWNNGGSIQNAAGRLYFEMPNNRRMRRWSGYVCSGTVTNDGVTGRSIIITAAHCVYDDINKAFARNVLFIPNQDQTTGSGTDLNCNNDPIGCWVPSFGVVDDDWTSRTFPDNIPWDYAFYVVEDSGSHQGTAASSETLDLAVNGFDVSFDDPVYGEFTHALGYSYSDDPNFMYCAEELTTEGSDNWWLASCDLSGGSSGGPWIQPMDETTGTGVIISVNSWGYTTSSGMAGPILFNTSAQCVFDKAKITTVSSSSSDGYAGVATLCQ